MTVLVYGKTGQLARALQDLAPGWVYLDRDAADLAQPDAGKPVRVMRPDLIVIAAAYTNVDGAETETVLANRINGQAPGEIAAAAQEVGAGLVHISTDYVYHGMKSEPWRESDAVAPLNAYGRSKRMGEVAVQAACQRSLILRTAWVHAPWGKNFVRTMLRFADRPELKVVDDQLGSPTSALDLAAAIHQIAPRLIAAPEGPLWGVRHYSGAGAVTWWGFAEEIFAQAKDRGLIAEIPEVAAITSAEWPTPSARPMNSVLDCRAFEADHGLAMVPWQVALGRVLDRMEPI